MVYGQQPGKNHRPTPAAFSGSCPCAAVGRLRPARSRQLLRPRLSPRGCVAEPHGLGSNTHTGLPLQNVPRNDARRQDGLLLRRHSCPCNAGHHHRPLRYGRTRCSRRRKLLACCLARADACRLFLPHWTALRPARRHTHPLPLVPSADSASVCPLNRRTDKHIRRKRYP